MTKTKRVRRLFPICPYPSHAIDIYPQRGQNTAKLLFCAAKVQYFFDICKEISKKSVKKVIFCPFWDEKSSFFCLSHLGSKDFYVRSRSLARCTYSLKCLPDIPAVCLIRFTVRRMVNFGEYQRGRKRANGDCAHRTPKPTSDVGEKKKKTPTGSRHNAKNIMRDTIPRN